MEDAFSFLQKPAWKVAPRLLGCDLVRLIDGNKVTGRIVETEAYDQMDAASHSYRGRTNRNAIMFGLSGHAYVYFTYGMYFCLNVVVGPLGYGSAVLIRAIEPLEGLNIIRTNRPKTTTLPELTNGPAKVCQALRVDRSLNGHDLHNPPLQLIINPPINSQQIARSIRVGISRDTDRLWRFFIKQNSFVS